MWMAEAGGDEDVHHGKDAGINVFSKHCPKAILHATPGAMAEFKKL